MNALWAALDTANLRYPQPRAGLADWPSMNDPDARKETGEMRKQMDSMMRVQP